MGLFGKRKDHWLVGTAQVVSVNAPPHAASNTSMHANVVVSAPGVAPYAVEYRELIVSISKFPSPGSVLPVRINPDNHHDIDVLWDEVPTNKDQARQAAEQMAAMMRGSMGPTGGTPSAGDAGTGDVLSRIQQMFPGATIQHGTASPTSGAQVKVTASNATGDPVARLEKLATLRANGIIDDAQFEALRAQILDQAGLG